MIPIIQEHLDAHAMPGQEGLLFPSDVKRQMWTSTVTNHFKKAAAIAGRGDLRFHDLRHTGAVMAAQQGATLADLQAASATRRRTRRCCTSTRRRAETS